MAFPKTKSPIKPKKMKKKLFSQAWVRGATKTWKRDFDDKKQFKKGKGKIE